MTATGAALVAGATGVVGTHIAERLLLSGRRVYGISRRAPELREDVPLDRFVHLAVDLGDRSATREALRGCTDVEAVFHCANAATEDARLAILDNLLAGLGAFGRITVLQGMKYYGCHLGPFRTPAREDDPAACLERLLLSGGRPSPAR